jgi:hypothetical protein
MRFCRGCASPYRLKGYAVVSSLSSQMLTHENDAPYGRVVVPSGSRGPLYWATYSQSLCVSVMLMRLHGTPRMAAVSACPTAETNRPLRVRVGSAHATMRSLGRSASEIMLREKALAMNVAMIDLSDPLGVCVLLPR